MITHIDVSSVLRRTVSDLYTNLVTRPTGATVRTEIEHQLAELGAQTLTVIDFSHVGLLDLSCADEVVAKLLLRYASGSTPSQSFFTLRGVSEAHLDAIEAVLERHRLALVVQPNDAPPRLVGVVTDAEQSVWQALSERAGVPCADAPEVLASAGSDVDASLERLRALGLVMQVGDSYVAVAHRGEPELRVPAPGEPVHRDETGEADRGPFLWLNTEEARKRLLNEGEIAWVYGPRRHELAPVGIDDAIERGQVWLRDIAGVTLAEMVRVVKVDLDRADFRRQHFG